MTNSLVLIRESGLLTHDDSTKLTSLVDDVQQSFATVQVFRTDTEAKVSVLNDMKHPTPDSKYWQAVREQDVFVSELVELSYQYRKEQIELKRLQRKLEFEKDEIEREAVTLEIEHKGFVLAQINRTAHHRVREIAMWAQIKNELTPLLKYGTEDVNLHQLEAMRIRFANEAQLINQYTPLADARNILGLAQAVEKASK